MRVEAAPVPPDSADEVTPALQPSFKP